MDQWTISPIAKSSSANHAFGVSDVVYDFDAQHNFLVRPVVYLSSNVKISSGTGSESDSFTLEK